MKKSSKRLVAIFCALLLFVLAVLGVLQLGCVYTDLSWTQWTPSYEKTDISPILKKTEKTDEDYSTLYAQTGLTRLAIDDMLSKNMQNRILDIQDYFFADHEVYADHFAPFTYLEKTNGNAPMAALKDGDIIVSATTRVSWWRYGHAAIVVNGDSEIILEALEPGTVSSLSYANSFDYLANFMILRPKLDEATKKAVAENALHNLVGIKYSLTTGVLSKKYKENITGTQCAHLVWYSYKKFGIDLDSNGGAVVKPQNMALSDQVEVVQVFGFDPERPWGKTV